jgi:hydroxymethylpyrimidine pyrophosphatase-like HAD family hydrolase
MIYCFDLDGTLCSDTGGDYPKATPRSEVISKLNQLYDSGHTIIVYTARGSTTGLDWHELTKNQVKAWNIKHHKLIMGKPGADVYVDDKSIHVLDFIKGVTKPAGG